MMAATREDETVTGWWASVDRVAFVSIVALAGLSLIIALAATPAIALKRGLEPFALFQRHVMAVGLALVAMTMLSMLSARAIRRIALLLGMGGLVALALVLIAGLEINGARRWLRFPGGSLQPSEFMKPAFVVLFAFLVSEGDSRPDMPARAAAGMLAVLTIGLVGLEPDIGQATLIVSTTLGLLVLAGTSLKKLGMLAGAALLAFAAAALSFDHVRSRLTRFLIPGNTAEQTARARRCFVEGGLWGRGPGEGTIKHSLPDAHTDFIFAVVAEEYGAVACLAIVALFAIIALRLLIRAIDDGDAFTRLAGAGLALMFAGQALINVGVNVDLLPAKGMTLPLISVGGSSTLGVGIAMGFALALGRRRPSAPLAPRPLETIR